jgi:hypothetical protein
MLSRWLIFIKSSSVISSCQLAKNHECFRDHLCPHHQGKDVTMRADRPTYIPPKTWCSVVIWANGELVNIIVKCLLSLAFLLDCCISILLQHVHHRVSWLTECEATVPVKIEGWSLISVASSITRSLYPVTLSTMDMRLNVLFQIYAPPQHTFLAGPDKFMSYVPYIWFWRTCHSVLSAQLV